MSRVPQIYQKMQLFLKNTFSQSILRLSRFCVAVCMRKKFSLAKRHHKITFVVATCVGTLMSFMVIFGAFSHLPVLGQVNFRITILAVPQCHNGIDDDGDTLIDYPDDPDCKSRDDIFESILPIHPPTVVCFAATSQ